MLTLSLVVLFLVKSTPTFSKNVSHIGTSVKRILPMGRLKMTLAEVMVGCVKLMNTLLGWELTKDTSNNTCEHI